MSKGPVNDLYRIINLSTVVVVVSKLDVVEVVCRLDVVVVDHSGVVEVVSHREVVVVVFHIIGVVVNGFAVVVESVGHLRARPMHKHRTHTHVIPNTRRGQYLRLLFLKL